MWDPRSYRDTDFGLTETEAFEPGDLDTGDDASRNDPHIMTVLGAIKPDQLGVCQVAEHVIAGPAADDDVDAVRRLDRLDFASAEIESFFTAGGRSMVDLTTFDQGRDAPGLRAIAQRVPVHLIASTGRHRIRGDGKRPSVESLTDEFLREIRDGIGPSAIRPGLLVVETGPDSIPAHDRVVLQAAASVAIVTGYPLFLRSVSGPVAGEALEHMLELGVPPLQVIAGGVDRTTDATVQDRIASLEVWLAFDHVGAELKTNDQARAESLLRLAEAGFAGRLLMSQGLSRPEDFVSWGGGPGWTHLLERFTLTLMEAGAAAGLVRSLLIENPAVALTIAPPAPAGAT
jgi:phosphotriesterase-related protein